MGGTRERAALDAVIRVGHRVLVGDLGDAEALHADAQARAVHHHEHRVEPLVRLADHPAGRTVQDHLARGVAVDAHLVLKATADDAVARADLRVLARALRDELRRDEERNALGAVRRVRQPCEHQVNDVFGHVMVARGDEDLLAGQLVAAIGLRFGFGAQHAEVGAAVRLRQAHRPGPLARGHLRQVQVLLFLRRVLQQALVGADRQSRIHRPRLVGRVLHLVERDLQQVRQSLAAVLGLSRRAPASRPRETASYASLNPFGVFTDFVAGSYVQPSSSPVRLIGSSMSSQNLPAASMTWLTVSASRSA